MNRRVYLDHSATTPLCPEAKQAVLDNLEVFGNTSSFHREGREARAAIEQARSQVANAAGAEPAEIVFTSGGSEANNMVLRAAPSLADERNEVIVSAIEHPSVLEPARQLTKQGMKVHYLPVDKLGRVRLAELKKALNDKVALVSVMSVNNEIGTIQDVKEITKLAHQAGAFIHTDAVQALGKLSVDVRALDVDYATFSAHKIGGPKGVGALYLRSGAPIEPLIMGGHQEYGLRAGTHNTLGIISFGAAAQGLPNRLRSQAETKQKVDQLFAQISAKIPHVARNGDPEKSAPGILNVSFAGAEGESILLALDNEGIAVSTGSACASGDTKPSHVLMAIKADPELAHGSVRFSFGPENTNTDIVRVMEVLPGIIKKLRAMSTAQAGEES